MTSPPRHDDDALALVYDSAHDRPRSAHPHPRALSFEDAQRAVEIELFDSGLMGQLIPPTPSRVTIEAPQGWSQTMSTDDLGVFSLAQPPPRVFRLRFDSPRKRVVTDWLHL